MSVHGLHDAADGGRERPFVGRERELARLRTELDRVSAGEPRLVSVDGPAGVGKTALVRCFLAQADGVHVLRASGEDSESLLPYGIVAQLAPQLSELQHSDPQPSDPLAVGAALVDLLRGLQSDHTIVVVIDNAHWADLPSLGALTFALRRLHNVRVLTVVITTDVADPQLPRGLRRILADDETTRLSLAGLSVAELRALSDWSGRTPLSQRAAARLREHTDGNPLHTRALLEQVPAEVLNDLYVPLPAPRSYESQVRGLLAECPPEGRLLIEAASVLGRSCTLDEAAMLNEVADALQAAEQAVWSGLLTERPTAGGLELRFPHPLVRAAVYQRLGPARRARLHLRATEVVAGDSARLSHRLRAAGKADEDLASDVASLARRNAARGHWEEAAEQMTWAARLSANDHERVRRTAEAVDVLLCDGRVAEASSLAGELAEDADPGPRGFAIGAVATVSGRPCEAETRLAEAWRHCDQQAEPAVAARIAEQLTFSQFMQGRCADGAVWAKRALALAPHHLGADLVQTVHLLGLLASGELHEGLRLTAGLPDAAVAAAGELDALLGRGLLLTYSDDIERAVGELTAVVAASPRRTVQYRLAALAALGWAEFHLGSWNDAAAHAEAAVSAALGADQTWFQPIAHGLAALVPAARGEWERASAHIQAALDTVASANGVGALTAATAQAHVAAARGDIRTLITTLEPLTSLSEGAQEPALLPWHEHLIDAHIAAGQIDRAENALVRYEKLAGERQRHSALASTGRLRGNLCAEHGDHDDAEVAYQSGLWHAEHVPDPFARARLELDYGTFLRRRGNNASAVDHLERARTAFEQLGARPYVQRCDKEIRSRGRRPAQKPASRRARLTAQERAVARLVASGLTNRQAARELVLSIKTIEYHLGNTYMKLGVNSRTELAAKLAEIPPPQGPNGANARDPREDSSENPGFIPEDRRL